MSKWRTAELLANQKAVISLFRQVAKLGQASLLNEWEEEFLRSVSDARCRLSPRQVSTLLAIWEERRPRYGSDGVSIETMVQMLRQSDLDENDRDVLKEIEKAAEQGFLQLYYLNQLAYLAQAQGYCFSPITKGWRVQSWRDEVEVRSLARAIVKDRRLSQRSRIRAQYVQSEGKRATADLSDLLGSLDQLQRAIQAT